MRLRGNILAVDPLPVTLRFVPRRAPRRMVWSGADERAPAWDTRPKQSNATSARLVPQTKRPPSSSPVARARPRMATARMAWLKPAASGWDGLLHYFSLAARTGESRPSRGCARSCPRGARTRSELLQRAASSIHDLQRQSRLSGPPRATVRGLAQGGGAGGMRQV
jgi:hypothetical protein